jgi:peptidylamidoglycolate lyase
MIRTSTWILVALAAAAIHAQTGTDGTHFDRPTKVAVAADGSLYVSDGYRNSRVVKFGADGRYLLQWGSKGSGPGQFDVPHGRG